MANPIIIYLGNTSQPLYAQLRGDNNKPLNIGTSTVKFNMRLADSDTLKINAASAVVDEAAKGLVHYNWTSSNLDTAGEYSGWWRLVDASHKIKDFSEFQIIVANHVPGLITRNGAIYKAAKSIIPVTWDALEKFPEYGDALLQERIETVKLSLFGQSVDVEDESTYDLRVIEFAAKLTALQVIPAGVDYWLSQYQSFVAQGTQESASYPDRVAALWKIYERLQIQIANDRAIIDEILGSASVARSLTDVPEVSGGTTVGFKTPVPSDSFPDYAFPHLAPEDNIF